jgi:autotransporter-associated beta strand protein
MAVFGNSRKFRTAIRTARIAIVALALLAEGIAGRAASAALIAGWDFQTTTNGGTAVAAAPSTPKLYVANFGTGTLYLNGQEGSSDWFVPGTGNTNTELNGFAGSSVNATNGLSSTTTSPAALAVVSGTNNAANGKFAVFKFSMTGWQDLVISLSAQRTSTGFTTQAWEYSTDGTTYSSIGSLVAGSTAGTITGTFGPSGVLTLPTVTGFNNAQNAYVRVAFTGATTASGNNRLDNIQFNASTFSPPSAILTWSGNGSAAGGAGTWSAAGTNWSSTGAAPFGSAWNSGAKAVFGTSGGAVTIDAGGVAAANGIDFDVDGYSLSGGVLTLGGSSSTISVATAATASINAAIAGSNGLTKTSAGTLVLGGENTFNGNVTVSGGTLQIASDSALGNASNDLAINGTLRTVSNLALGADRAVTGVATLDIAPGTSLTISGSAGLATATLANSGTLSLDGASRTLGSVTFDTASTIAGSGPVTIGGINASAVTSGTATIAPGVAFGSGDQQVSVGTGGTLLLDGDISGSTGRMIKTGAGTLIVTGSSSAGYRIGATGGTPTDGGTVILGQADSAGTSQIQLNYGTLQTDAAGGLTFANGVSMGGRSNAVAVFGGTGDLTFSGSSSFFRGNSTSGELRVDVNNSTEFSGEFGATSGGGTATGITFGGTGSLTFSGNASALVDAITLQDSVDLIVSGTLGSAVTVGAGNAIGGDGTILGSLAFTSGADFLFDPLKTLTVNGPEVTFGNFGISDLIGFSAAVLDGSYTLIDGSAVINTANLANLGPGNAVDLGGGRSAYFTEGSLVLQVVPEPSSFVLAGLGVVLARIAAVRRHRSSRGSG